MFIELTWNDRAIAVNLSKVEYIRPVGDKTEIVFDEAVITVKESYREVVEEVVAATSPSPVAVAA